MRLARVSVRGGKVVAADAFAVAVVGAVTQNAAKTRRWPNGLDRRSKSRTKSRNDDVSPVDKEITVAMPEIDSTRVRSKARDPDPEKT